MENPEPNNVVEETENPKEEKETASPKKVPQFHRQPSFSEYFADREFEKDLLSGRLPFHNRGRR